MYGRLYHLYTPHSGDQHKQTNTVKFSVLRHVLTTTHQFLSPANTSFLWALFSYNGEMLKSIKLTCIHVSLMWHEICTVKTQTAGQTSVDTCIICVTLINIYKGIRT